MNNDSKSTIKEKQPIKDIVDLDFETIISNDVANEYKDEYEYFHDMLSCYNKLTLKEYTYCSINNIDGCEFIAEKYKDCYCNKCNDSCEMFRYPLFGTNILANIIMVLIIIFISIFIIVYGK